MWKWLKSIFKRSPSADVPSVPPSNLIKTDPPTDTRFINQAGLLLVCSFEGFYSAPYLDPVGIPTIGFGTIGYPDGRKVSLADPRCTQDQAMEWLRWEIDIKAQSIARYLHEIGLTLTDNQFSALCSFGYNLGLGPIISSGRSLNSALKSHNHQAICDTILLYDKAGGKPFRGLTRRRKAEVALYNT